MAVRQVDNRELMDPKQIVAQGYDVIGEWYANQADQPLGDDDDRERYTSLVVRELQAGAELLDLGCGAGVPTTRRFAEYFAVTGVDISSEQIARARRNVPSATFIHGDMAGLEFGPATFDAVTGFFAIIHLPRREHAKLFRDIAGWLRPGGIFVAGLGARPLEGEYEEDWHGAPMFWSHFDSDTNKRLVEEAGLNLESTEEVTVEEDGEPVTFLWVVARKPARETP